MVTPIYYARVLKRKIETVTGTPITEEVVQETLPRRYYIALYLALLGSGPQINYGNAEMLVDEASTKR